MLHIHWRVASAEFSNWFKPLSEEESSRYLPRMATELMRLTKIELQERLQRPPTDAELSAELGKVDAEIEHEATDFVACLKSDWEADEGRPLTPHEVEQMLETVRKYLAFLVRKSCIGTRGRKSIKGERAGIGNILVSWIQVLERFRGDTDTRELTLEESAAIAGVSKQTHHAQIKWFTDASGCRLPSQRSAEASESCRKSAIQQHEKRKAHEGT